MSIESMARAHWWTRHRETTYADQAVAVLMGAADPTAQLAADEINRAWETAKNQEIQAMRDALGTETLASLVTARYDVPSTRTQPR